MFKKGDIIHLKEDDTKWGIVTYLSDDESTVYYNPRGASLTRVAVTPDLIELDHPEIDPDNLPEHKTDGAGLVRVYTFPNGFQKEAMNVYKALLLERMTPSWKFDRGNSLIYIPEREYQTMLEMAIMTPRRWGNVTEIARNASKS